MVLCLALICSACATLPSATDQAAQEKEVQRLQQRLLEHPEDTEALRDLGALYVQMNNVAQGYDHLKKAYERDADDPKTLFYLGAASEAVGNQQAALRVYERYSEVKRTSPYRRWMEGRYRWLVRELARQEIRKNLAKEDSLGPPSPQIVGVFPLRYIGEDERYAVLGRGLSELITDDLTRLRRLQVVERVRLQALLDELKLAESPYFDPATAPRSGRLLGAGRIVGGSYSLPGGDNLQVQVLLLEAENGQILEPPGASDALRNLFRLKAEIVFNLIEEMGLELTPEERERIEFIPTENLQAFLAYSRGLEREDVGDFGAATQHFEQAVALDPDFDAAGEHAEAAEALSTAGGTVEEALVQAIGLERSPTPTELLDSRLGSLNTSLGASIIPGPDARNSGDPNPLIRPVLPDPPAPPDPPCPAGGCQP